MTLAEGLPSERNTTNEANTDQAGLGQRRRLRSAQRTDHPGDAHAPDQDGTQDAAWPDVQRPVHAHQRQHAQPVQPGRSDQRQDLAADGPRPQAPLRHPGGDRQLTPRPGGHASSRPSAEFMRSTRAVRLTQLQNDSLCINHAPL